MKRLLLFLVAMGLWSLIAGGVYGQSLVGNYEDRLMFGKDYAKYTSHLGDSSLNIDAKDPKRAWRLSSYPTVVPSTIGTAMFVFLDDETHPPFFPDRYTGLKLIGASLLVGPSIGHLYAEQWKQSAVGIGLRSVGIILSVGGFLRSQYCIKGGLGFGRYKDCTIGRGFWGALATLGGSALTLGSAYHDIRSADQSARKHNREIREKAKFSFQPFVSPINGTIGMSLRIRL